MGPVNPPQDDTGSWSAPPRHTSNLLWAVREYGRVPVIGEVERQRAVADLIFWRASVVVLIPGSRNEEALRQALLALLGEQPQQVGGVLLWDVRDLPVPPLE
jgi:hypothetical protein